MRKGILCALLCNLALGLTAQSGEFLPGYIVSTAQDTTYGFIKDVNRKKMNTEVQFKTTLTQDEPTVYSANEIEAFFVKPSSYYASFNVEINDKTERRFLHKLVEGYASLYQYAYHEYGDPLKGERYIYIITKDSEEQIQLSKLDSVEAGVYKEDKAYFGRLKYIFRDCEEFITMQKVIPYRVNDLANAVIRYNKCVQPSSSTSSLYKKRELEVKFGGIVGVRRYTIIGSLDQFPYKAFEETGIGLEAGPTVQFSYSGNLSLQLSALYANYATDYETGQSFYTYEIQHQFSAIKIPATLHYRFLDQKFSPHLFVGFGRGIYLGGDVKISYQESSLSDRRIQEEHQLDFSTIGVELWTVGVGTSLLMNSKTEIQLNAAMTTTRLLLSDFRMRDLGVNLGVLF